MAPVAKGRPRMTKRGICYTPAATRAAEKMIAQTAMQYAPAEPLMGPIELELIFYMPIPRSTTKKQRCEMLLKAHTKKPDVDNLTKLVMDALTLTGAYWNDDAQVWHTDVRKIYSNGEPKIVITIR